MHDLLTLYNEEEKRLYAILSLGEAVCGHPKTVHGGTDSAPVPDAVLVSELYSLV